MTNSIFVRNYIDWADTKFYVFDGQCVDLYVLDGEDYNYTYVFCNYTEFGNE